MTRKKLTDEPNKVHESVLRQRPSTPCTYLSATCLLLVEPGSDDEDSEEVE